MIISLVCCVGHSVRFHLFPFSCSSEVSSAFQASVACSSVTCCLSTFSSGKAMADTSCSVLSLVFLDSWLCHACLSCGGNCASWTSSPWGSSWCCTALALAGQWCLKFWRNKHSVGFWLNLQEVLGVFQINGLCCLHLQPVLPLTRHFISAEK